MAIDLNYTVTLEETLKGKTVTCLREASRMFFRIPHAKEMSRDEIADRILELLLPNSEFWLLFEIECMNDDAADVLRDMIFKGPQRLSADDGLTTARTLKFLQELYWVDCRACKDGKKTVCHTVAVPEEIRANFKDAEDFKDLRVRGDFIVDYACSAVTLYGVVSIKELQELTDRYCPAQFDKTLGEGEHWFPMGTLEAVLWGRACSSNCEYILRNNWILHEEFGEEELGFDDLIDRFIKMRNEHERWYPKDGDEFLSYESDYYFLDMPECARIEDFLQAHGTKDENECVAMLYELVRHIQIEVKDLGTLVRDILDKAEIDFDAYAGELCTLMASFVNRIRRRDLNGWTPEEAYAREVVGNGRPPVFKAHSRPAVGRNAPCPCGSGKKYKKCCGMKA